MVKLITHHSQKRKGPLGAFFKYHLNESLSDSFHLLLNHFHLIVKHTTGIQLFYIGK